MSAHYRLAIWWHRKRTGHHTYMWRVEPPAWAGRWPGGVMVRCDCGKLWLDL